VTLVGCLTHPDDAVALPALKRVLIRAPQPIVAIAAVGLVRIRARPGPRIAHADLVAAIDGLADDDLTRAASELTLVTERALVAIVALDSAERQGVALTVLADARHTRRFEVATLFISVAFALRRVQTVLERGIIDPFAAGAILLDFFRIRVDLGPGIGYDIHSRGVLGWRTRVIDARLLRDDIDLAGSTRVLGRLLLGSIRIQIDSRVDAQRRVGRSVARRDIASRARLTVLERLRWVWKARERAHRPPS
jgi:hypothetical protein